jgi:aspartokinase-like uncharacterized kinase
MAIAAMDQYGRFLESEGFGATVEDPASLSAADSPSIFLPYHFLRSNDVLPHSWSVTSDSIAAYLAWSFRVERLLLLKAVDAPASPCPVAEAIEAGIVDAEFDAHLANNTECWLVNGKHPKRLLDLERSAARLIRDPVL